MSSMVSDSQNGNLTLVNNDNVIEVNVLDCELPYVDEGSSNDIRIQAFYNNYYSIIMALSILDELIKRYDKEVLNRKLRKLFRYYSNKGYIVKDLDMFYELLVFSKDIYYDECNKYSKGLKCGSILAMPIFSVHLGRFISIIKECLNTNGNFELMINVNNRMSKLSLDILDSYMNSKYNIGLSIRLFSDDVELYKGLTRRKVVNL